MKKCILIFDDDQEILSVSKIILEQRNYRVETKTCCDNIIQNINLVKPDLILMDLWMPQVGGENAIKLIKNNGETRHIPVILFSANAEITQICDRSNANGFIKKPFKIATFLSVIEKNILEMN
jgi:CheY-like chemotaxis protein